MEAKEVTGIVEIYWHPNISKSELEVIVEISFKAGQNEGQSKVTKANQLGYKEGKLAGIKEGIRLAYEDMVAKHYVIGYNLDTLVVRLRG